MDGKSTLVRFSRALTISFLLSSLLTSQNLGVVVKVEGIVGLSVQGDETTDAIARAVVRLYSEDELIETKSDNSGRFVFMQVQPGIYDLEVSAAGFKKEVSRGIRIDEGKANVLKVNLGVANQSCGLGSRASYEKAQASNTGSNLDGVVIENDTKASVPGATLILSSEQSGAREATIRANRSGKFVFPRVPPGSYQLLARQPRYADEVLPGVLVTRRTKRTSPFSCCRKGQWWFVSNLGQ